MLSIYPAIIHEEPEGVWIDFPDLEGCQSCGDDLRSAMSLAQEALGLYLASLADRHLKLPAASNLSDVSGDGVQASYIAVDLNEYRQKKKAVKRMVSIPQWMAEEAEERNLSLSRTLQKALEEQFSIA